MAKKTIEISVLSANRIRDGRKKLEDYKKTLEGQCITFCERLAQEGLTVARNSAPSESGLGKYIIFEKECVSSSSLGVEYIVKAESTQQLLSADKTQEIDPLLLAEYGAGLYALPQQSFIDGSLTVGRGSYNPSSVNAFNDQGWYYKDDEGKWHHSFGTHPTQPMLNAYTEMVKKIDKIAKEVFG